MTNDKFTNFPPSYYAKELKVTSYFQDLLFQLRISGLVGNVIFLLTSGLDDG